LTNRYTLILPQSLYQALLDHALSERPNECCGLLAGTRSEDIARVRRHFPLVNAAKQPEIEYLSEPRSILAASRAIRAAGLEEVAVYHSHPTSEAVPSRKDCGQNAYGDWLMHLIISLKTGQPTLRGWWLYENRFEEGKWEIAEDEAG
jgi:proteasome lid subunit RPN8/RPN11